MSMLKTRTMNSTLTTMTKTKRILRTTKIPSLTTKRISTIWMKRMTTTIWTTRTTKTNKARPALMRSRRAVTSRRKDLTASYFAASRRPSICAVTLAG
ncbi:hypothetical protein ACPOL_4144 [Acidisarcina polymorpha]|uniref:Uncharacterized protein n=1 Tax=Acidisarcina polymorpha TaxID=2211140 RepID=A0A2Z5G2R3_9BACT|nr:hypothetical protein ACPOL_4144 [Acidisarcina polymorpha]